MPRLVQALITLTLLPLGAAHAAPGDLAAASTVASATPRPQIQVTAHAQSIGSAEFAAIRGEYRLADGRRLMVEGPRHRPVVALNDQAPVGLVALGPNRYASADGAMQLDFNAHANGNVDTVTLTLQTGTH